MNLAKSSLAPNAGRVSYILQLEGLDIKSNLIKNCLSYPDG